MFYFYIFTRVVKIFKNQYNMRDFKNFYESRFFILNYYKNNDYFLLL